MESPLAQRMERLCRSLLMIVASSSALRRSLLPPNGSSIEADWSRRKMKQPGFFRLISALYMLAPFLRLLRAFHSVGFDFLGRDVDLVGPPILHRGAFLHLRGELFRLQDRWNNRRQRALAEEQRSHPPGEAQQDERDPDVEQLERSTELRASAGRTRRHGSPLGEPFQAACPAPQEARGQHGSDPRTRLVRLLAPSTARPAHIGASSEMPTLRTCVPQRATRSAVWASRAAVGRETYTLPCARASRSG